jgi:outer membrane immunogenic protein
MSNSLIVRFAFAALLPTVLALPVDSANAQSPEGVGVSDLEKENAGLRARIRRLEAERDNAALRVKPGALEERRSGYPSQAQASRIFSAPGTRVAASASGRTLVMADLPVKAAPIPLPGYSWTGFYFGGNIGYGVGSDRAVGDQSQSNGILTFTAAAFSPTAVSPVGVIGGGQIGYNWQATPSWLLGVEADFQGSEQKGTSCVLHCFNEHLLGGPLGGGAIQLPADINNDVTVTHSLDYFGTLRGRVGVVDGGALFFVTGGGAYGRVSQTLQSVQSNSGVGTAVANVSAIQNKFGFVVGGGVEAALGGNWTGKVEYLYLDLGDIGTPKLGALAPGTAPFVFNASSTIHDNIVRLGVNYRIGAPAPLSAYNAMAAVPPLAMTYGWSGFYVGGNIGYGFGHDHIQTGENEVSLPASSFIANSQPGTFVTPKGVLGGGQVGYNWQAGSRWLIGIEGDLQGAAQTDTSCGPLTCLVGTSGAPVDNRNFITIQHQIDYFSTVRGRVGAIFNNNLFYVTGGSAFAHVKQTVNREGILEPPVSAVSTQDMVGYAVGGGIEAMLGGGWSAKAEYLYMNLGDIQTTFNAMSVPRVQSLTVSADGAFRDHIVRIGANYHFSSAQ